MNKYNDGPVDSLAKLYYKSSLKYGSLSYEMLLNAIAGKMMAE